MSLCSYMEKGSEAENATVQIFPKTRVNESVSAAVVIQHLPSGNSGWGMGRRTSKGKVMILCCFFLESQLSQQARIT